ncbi:MAG: hypothetical protein KAI83_05905, partial [Thiomargarita sp.]|nr:hypothetical protein [Thiomargarita sp.]
MKSNALDLKLESNASEICFQLFDFTQFSGSYAPAWEPIRDAPASCGLRDAGASPRRSHASALIVIHK